MDNPPSEVKEARLVLRRVQDHLFAAHESLGATRETLGMVEVMRHPTHPAAALNYVTPRRNTAWISATMLKNGLERLQQAGRPARVQYIEALYPPQFADTVRGLKLVVERETPLMIYRINGAERPLPSMPPELPEGVSIAPDAGERGVRLWRDARRGGAAFDVLTLGVEPLFVGHDPPPTHGQQADILLLRDGLPVGVTRLSRQGETAHLLALALRRDLHTPPVMRALLLAALRQAADAGSGLVFAPGPGEADRDLLRGLGFANFGLIICYSDEQAREERDESDLDQPLLSL